MPRFIKYFSLLSLLIFSTVLLACQSVKQPASIPEALNYSVKNEIERIDSFMETEPVRALWRASLLGHEEVIERCFLKVQSLLEASIADKKYLDAKRYYKSLSSVKPGWTLEGYTYAEIEKLANAELPGYSLEKNKAKYPAKMSECMKAAVTVWVDRGVTVKNGAGYADIIIGSGFFIDERGYIITNHHVIDSMVNPKYEGYCRLYIKLPDDNITKIPAKVVGYDSLLDLALLNS